MELQRNGKTVSYMDTNTDKPVILFLHGWGAPVSTYSLLLDYLAERFRVVAPDLPGFGGSDQPDTPWSVDDYVDFVIDFAQTLHLQKVILMCHSFGGRISIKLLNRKNLPFTVEKAVFIDAAGIRPKRGVQYYTKVYSFKLMKKLANIPAVTKLCPALEQKVKNRSGSADYRNASPMMRQVMVRCIEEDLTHLLPGISVPTLLIWGELDTATPLSDGQTMEKLIPDAGLVTLQGAGHFSFAEGWGICRRVLDSFL